MVHFFLPCQRLAEALVLLSKRTSPWVQLVYAILTTSVMHLVSKYGHYERAVTGGLCAKLMADREGQKKVRTAASVSTKGEGPLHLLHHPPTSTKPP